MSDIVKCSKCGKAISCFEAGRSWSVHVNRGSQPHSFEIWYDCADCFNRAREIKEQCVAAGQDKWRDTRVHILQISSREFATKAGLSHIAYTKYESLREVAPESFRKAVEAVLYA